MRYIIRKSNIIRNNPEFYFPKEFVSNINNNISIENYSGGKVLNLISSGGKSFLKGTSIKAILTINGFEDCIIDLNKPIEAKIEPFSKMKIFYKDIVIFYGYISEYIDFTKIERKDKIQIKLKGLQEKLKKVSINKNYPALTKITDIIKDICEIINNEHTDIIYDSNKILVTSLSTIPIDLSIKNKTAFKMLTVLCDLINAYWFIDENGIINVKDIDYTIKNVIFEGKSNIELNYDLENIRNNIYVKRQTTTGSGETGWTIPSGFPMNNLTSIKIYGKHTYEFIVPEYFDDATCSLIGSKILNEYAFPKYQGNAKNLKFGKYNLGLYKLILKPDIYFQDYSQLDDINELIINNVNNEIIQIDTNNQQSGFGCLKLTNFQTGNNVEIIINKKFIGHIENFYCFIKNFGDLVKIYFEIGNNNESQNFIIITKSNQYILYKTKLQKTIQIYDYVKIKILESNQNDIIFIDNIYYSFFGNQNLDLFAKKIEYNISNKKNFVNITFEREPLRIENYLKNLNEKIEILNFITEKR